MTLTMANGEKMTITLDGGPRGVRLQSTIPATCPIPAAPPVPQPQWTGLEADQAHLTGRRLVDVDGTTNLGMIIWRPTEQMWCWRVKGDPQVYWNVTLEAAQAAINKRLGLPGGEYFGW